MLLKKYQHILLHGTVFYADDKDVSIVLYSMVVCCVVLYFIRLKCIACNYAVWRILLHNIEKHQRSD